MKSCQVLAHRPSLATANKSLDPEGLFPQAKVHLPISACGLSRWNLTTSHRERGLPQAAEGRKEACQNVTCCHRKGPTHSDVVQNCPSPQRYGHHQFMTLRRAPRAEIQHETKGTKQSARETESTGLFGKMKQH